MADARTGEGTGGGRRRTEESRERIRGETAAPGTTRQGRGHEETMKGEAREKMEEVKGEAREKGRELERAAEERADRWTHRASHQASTIAHALRTAGRDLEEHGESRIAHWSESAAHEVEKMADYLEDEDPRSIFHDVESLARRNPAAFVGGTFAAGLLLGRFLRSSEPGSQRAPMEGESRRI